MPLPASGSPLWQLAQPGNLLHNRNLHMATAEKIEKVNGKMAKKEKSPKAEAGSRMDALMDQNPNLKMAFQQIEKQFGEGSIMPLGGDINMKIAGIPTGSLSLD